MSYCVNVIYWSDEDQALAAEALVLTDCMSQALHLNKRWRKLIRPWCCRQRPHRTAAALCRRNAFADLSFLDFDHGQ